MDELADALRLDPAELRLRNDTQVDPERTLPFASRHLTGALREGAARFGWDKRRATPASVREGKVCWSRGRFRDPRRRAAERDGACPAGKRWPAGGRVGDDRHRDRHLHDPESDRCRDDGAAGQSYHRSSRRHPLQPARTSNASSSSYDEKQRIGAPSIILDRLSRREKTPARSSSLLNWRFSLHSGVNQ